MRKFERTSASTLLLLLGLAASTMVVAVSKRAATFVQIDGRVSMNGTPASKGATVLSDSTIKTEANSSAVVSLGKLGRVEVMPDSTMKLGFTDSGLSVSMLEAGRVRVSSSSGISATATTNDGEVVAQGAQQNVFTVDTSCGNTLVAVEKGRVELRAGNSVKQIAAGGQDTAGQARPGCVPSRNH